MDASLTHLSFSERRQFKRLTYSSDERLPSEVNDTSLHSASTQLLGQSMRHSLLQTVPTSISRNLVPQKL